MSGEEESKPVFCIPDATAKNHHFPSVPTIIHPSLTVPKVSPLLLYLRRATAESLAETTGQELLISGKRIVT